MLLRPDSLDRGDIVTDGVMSLLLEAGPSGVSLRRLADRLGCSVGALTNQWRSRGRILHVAVNEFRHRWNGLLVPRSLRDGISGLLPADDDEAEGTSRTPTPCWVSEQQGGRGVLDHPGHVGEEA
jgi:AcrR family transcriptional regulator